MPDDIDTFMDYWVYGIERRLRSLLEPVWPDPDTDDEPIFISAKEDRKIRAWLSLPPEQKSREERQRIIEQDLMNHGYSPEESHARAVRESRLTGRATGRPRTNGPYAIKALVQQLTTGKTYRQMVEEFRGPCGRECRCPKCGDVLRPPAAIPSGLKPRRKKLPTCTECGSATRPEDKQDRVCYRCADALRDAVGELVAFLKSKDIYPNVPPRKELDKMTSEEIAIRWPLAVS